MSDLKKFPKIPNMIPSSLLKSSVKEWEISEKIDGSNFRIDLSDFTLGSRNNIISEGGGNFGMIIDHFNAVGPHFRKTTATKYGSLIVFGEAVTKPKHNKLLYDRIPYNGLIIYQLFDSLSDKWLVGEEKEVLLIDLSAWLGCDFVKKDCVFDHYPTQEDLQPYLDLPSRYGPEREGVVITPYDNDYRAGSGEPLWCKAVRQAFREKMGVKIKAISPDSSVFVDLAKSYLTPMRFAKATTKLKDDEKWKDNEAENIGALIGVIAQDIMTEDVEEIKNTLLKGFKKKLGGTVGEFVRSEILGNN